MTLTASSLAPVNDAAVTAAGAPAAWRPLPLPRSAAQAHTRLARRVNPATLTLASPSGEPVTVGLALAPAVPEVLAQSMAYVAVIEWAGARLLLGLPALGWRLWLAADPAQPDVNTLPEPLARLALETLCDTALAALGQTVQGAARVVETPPPVQLPALLASPAWPHAWTLQVQAGGESLPAVLAADGLGLLMLAGLAQSLPEPAADPATTLADLPVALRLWLGTTWATPAALAGLRRGDVLVIDDYRVGPEGHVWLATDDGQTVAVSPHPAGWQVISGWKAMSEHDLPPSADAADSLEAMNPADFDGVPVRLTFDLGEHALTLGELRRMQPGEVIDLQRPMAGGQVRVRANGAVLGRGELVDLDGSIGVRLLALGRDVS